MYYSDAAFNYYNVVSSHKFETTDWLPTKWHTDFFINKEAHLHFFLHKVVHYLYK